MEKWGMTSVNTGRPVVWPCSKERVFHDGSYAEARRSFVAMGFNNRKVYIIIVTPETERR